MPENTLVVPFLNQSPDFAFGVEYGMLYARMRAESAGEIADFFPRAIQEDVLLLANRLGWRVAKVRPWREWFFCRMEKGPPPSGGGG